MAPMTVKTCCEISFCSLCTVSWFTVLGRFLVMMPSAGRGSPTHQAAQVKLENHWTRMTTTSVGYSPDMTDMTVAAPSLPLARRWKQRHSSAIAAIPLPGSYLFVVPHPDDETLTVGGLLSRLSRSGSDVRVVAVTDGGAAYPGVFDHDDLAMIRRNEQLAALGQLGVPRDRVTSLGLRDGEVSRHEDQLIDRLTSLCDESTTVVAPWHRDVHPDHEAVGRATAAAAQATASTVWSSLFWAWHHHASHALDDERMIKVDVTAQLEAKSAAIDCHLSQLVPSGASPVLDDATLEPARWKHEFYILHPESAGAND